MTLTGTNTENMIRSDISYSICEDEKGLLYVEYYVSTAAGSAKIKMFQPYETENPVAIRRSFQSRVVNALDWATCTNMDTMSVQVRDESGYSYTLKQ